MASKHLHIYLFLVSLLLAAGVQIQAQQITNSGKEFWFAFPETYDTNKAVYWVNITANTAASGTVSVPGQAWSQNFNFTAGQVSRVDIPSNLAANTGSDTNFNKAIRVTSNNEVVVFAVTYHKFRHEASLVLPNRALGTRYRAVTYKSETKNGLQESEFCIVAVNDTAVVQITPKANIAGGKTANTPYTVTIPPNHVYQAQALSDTDDLTGTLIESANGKTFSVYSGNVWSTIVCSPNSDPILEAMFPTNTWGRDYFLIPTPSVGKDYIRILADQDSTQIYRDGVFRKTLNAGEFYEDTITTIRRYTSNNPVAAAHFMVTGEGGCTNYSNTDPSMIILNPTEQMFLDSISFFAVDTNQLDSHYVHVLTRTADVNKMFLNGVLMTGWTAFAQDATYSYKTLRVTPGSHRMETTGCGFIAYSMGNGNAVSYGYATGASLVDLEKDISYTNYSGSDTICRGDSVLFEADVRGNPVSYKWYFGDGDSSDLASPVHKYPNTGTYIVRAYIVYPCIPYDTLIDTIVVPEFVSTYTVTQNNVSCFGGQDGWAVPQGTYLKTIQWDSTITQVSADTALMLSAGSYQLTLIDSGGCAQDTIIAIVEPSVLQVDSIRSDSVLCFGDSTGAARVYTSGGTTPYSYQWDAAANNQSDSSATQLPIGTFRVTVTDTNQCQVDTVIDVNQPDSIRLSGGQQDILCFGDSTGKAWVVAQGGTGLYIYSWSRYGTTVLNDTVTQINADTFRVQVTDANSCTSDTLFTLTEPSELSIDSMTLTHVGCFGDSTGMAVIHASGGTGNYTYNWSSQIGQATADTAFSVKAGTHYVTVTDANNCQITDSFTLNQPTAALSATTASTDVLCNGDSTGKAWITIAGGSAPYSYLWDLNANQQTTDTAFSLAARSYLVQVTDTNGCTLDTSITVNEPPALTIDSILQDSVLCYGDTTGGARAYPSGGAGTLSYQWDSQAGNQSQFNATGLAQGYYRVSITDTNACLIDTAITVLQPDSLVIAGVQQNILCHGDSTGHALALASGGTGTLIYTWNKYGSTVVNDSLVQIPADTFRITVTDANSCQSDSLFTLTEPTLLTIDTLTLTHVNCFGESTGQAIVTTSGGVTPYTYTWSASITQTTGDTAFNVPAGTHFVTVTDNNNCQRTDSFTLTQPVAGLGLALLSSDVLCNGDSTGRAWGVVTGGTTPYSYQWDVAANNQITDTAFALKTGSYQLDVTDSLGCTINSTVQVGQPTALTLALAHTDILCFGESTGWIKATGTGGVGSYTYQWTPAGTGQGTDSLHNLIAGVYILLMSDSNACTISDTAELIQPSKIELTLTNTGSDTLCIGDQVQLNTSVVGGTLPYQYSWSTGATTSSITDAPTTQTDYSVVVTDFNNCPGDSDQITIYVMDIQSDSFSVSATGPVCLGDSVQVSGYHQGDFPPYVYSWTPTFIGSDTGSYSYFTSRSRFVHFAVSDQCGNNRSDSAYIEVNPLPDISLNDTAFSGCEPLAISLSNNNHSSDYTYYWDLGDGNSSTASSVEHLYRNAGQYLITVEVENQFGCKDSAKETITAEVWPWPMADIEADKQEAIVGDAVFQLEDLSTGSVSNQWSMLDSLLGEGPNLEVILEDTGIHTIQLIAISEFDCRDTTWIELQVGIIHDIRVPNAFRPNANGFENSSYDPENPDNQVFFPYVDYAEEYDLMIYDRWGELIFHSQDVEVGWNGFYKGKLSPQDVYYWKLRVRFSDGVEKTMTGDITLLH